MKHDRISLLLRKCLPPSLKSLCLSVVAMLYSMKQYFVRLRIICGLWGLYFSLLIVLLPVGNGSVPIETTCSADDIESSCVAEVGNKECKDGNYDCGMWALAGECESNETYMKTNCALSCGLCTSKEDCQDLHEQCGPWSKASECILNPIYMQSACRFSCDLCVGKIDRLRTQGIPEAEIQRKINYAQTNFGVTQLVAGTEEEVLQIKTQLQEVENYARHTVTMMDKETRDLCHNNFDQCTFWASEKKCRGTDLEFMMKHCPLACMDCHVVKSFHRCADKRDPISKPSISTNGGIDEIFESIIASKGTAFSKYGPEVLVMPNENEEGNDSWIIRLDSFLTTEEADGLIQLGNTLGWKPTVQDDDIEDRNPKNRVPFRRSESSMCDSDENGSCSGNELYQRIIERIATITGVPTSHFEPMDMVKYGYADSYGVHHDIRVHDVWMPAGPRILSLFVDLTDVEEGGATGFPDLDWLFVKAKKGQALLWSNVLRSDPTNMNPKMYHEALPVVEGEKYGANFWLHLYDWQDAKSQDCINSK